MYVNSFQQQRRPQSQGLFQISTDKISTESTVTASFLQNNTVLVSQILLTSGSERKCFLHIKSKTGLMSPCERCCCCSWITVCLNGTTKAVESDPLNLWELLETQVHFNEYANKKFSLIEMVHSLRCALTYKDFISPVVQKLYEYSKTLFVFLDFTKRKRKHRSLKVF